MSVPDPSLHRSAYGSCLIIGKSGSGKTTLLLSILKALLKQKTCTPLFTLNVKSKEYSQQFSALCTASFDTLDQLPRHAVIVVEDLIDLSRRHSVLLKQSLNYASHHKRQKLFVVTHHVYKNNVFNLLPYFTYIIFTSAQSNLPILDNVLKFFKIDKTALSAWLQQFRDATKARSFQYFIFDCFSHMLYRADSQKDLLLGKIFPITDIRSNPDSSIVSTLQHRFNLLSVHHPLHDVGNSVFSILCHSIDCSLINPNDLTLKTYSNKQKTFIPCSLVDYVFSLIDRSANVSPQSMFLHHYFKNKCQIPHIFIQNPLLH